MAEAQRALRQVELIFLSLPAVRRRVAREREAGAWRVEL